MRSTKKKLSVIIPTMEKDADLLEGAIGSVDWADEVLVVDSSFSSKIKKIADWWNVRYLAHEYVYSAKQKNWAIPQVENEWILLLDSDEVVTNELKETIQEMLSSKEIEDFDGYGIARKHFFFGKFLRWGGRYPLYNVRLFKRSCRYEDRDVHAHIILEKERVKNIDPQNGDILHFSDRDFEQFFERFNRYSDYQAQYMMKIARNGVRVNWISFFTNFYYFKAVIKDIWFFIPFTPFLRFLWMYVFRLGFLDG
ncbi:MAG: glycosyltransferase family 2 protein, partial [Candidatus Moraniibacteriota bacterium]